jgi:hypothetical protein
MKNFILTLLLLLAYGYQVCGQSTDPLMGKCLQSAGADARYLKDFRIQLGKTTAEGDLRYKANISLWKDMKYRFTLCNEGESKGLLILNVKDDGNKMVLSSFDKKTGKAYTSVDFTCNKSGIYQLSYDFTEKEQGSGIGLVSIVK